MILTSCFNDVCGSLYAERRIVKIPEYTIDRASLDWPHSLDKFGMKSSLITALSNVETAAAK